jgi:hypothetical protein
VPTASSIQMLNNYYYKIEDAHNLTICKPPTKEHLNYSILLDSLKIFKKVNNIGLNFWNFVCS